MQCILHLINNQLAKSIKEFKSKTRPTNPIRKKETHDIINKGMAHFRVIEIVFKEFKNGIFSLSTNDNYSKQSIRSEKLELSD